MNRKRISIGIATILIAGIAVWYFWGRTPAHKVSYQTSTVARGTISNSVTATGTVEPVTQVEVGTQVSGIVDKLYVDYNSEVKKGQVIAELDKTNLRNEFSSSRSTLENAKTEYEYQLKNYTRIKTLHEKQLVSDADYETAWHTYESAKNSYDVSKNNVAKAETNLGYATIYSPIDGVVLSRAVEEGQTVAASFSTPTLFTIAKDLTDMRVIADVDEADIGEVKEGQRVTFIVDAFPNDLFSGFVTQVRRQATTTNNVVTYEVVISAPNPDLKLMPGLTATVTIFILERQNVLTVPARALRFAPIASLIGEDDTVADTEGENKLWTREGKTFTAHPVQVGMSNGILTEVTGGIAEGTAVLTDVVIGQLPGQEANGNGNGNGNGGQTESSPFMPARPGGRR